MSYYSKNEPMLFATEEEEKRFLKWVKHISDWRIVSVPQKFKDKYGRVTVKYVEKITGTGIAEPTTAELARVYAKPCRYRRAARASIA